MHCWDLSNLSSRLSKQKLACHPKRRCRRSSRLETPKPHQTPCTWEPFCCRTQTKRLGQGIQGLRATIDFLSKATLVRLCLCSVLLLQDLLSSRNTSCLPREGVEKKPQHRGLGLNLRTQPGRGLLDRPKAQITGADSACNGGSSPLRRCVTASQA